MEITYPDNRIAPHFSLFYFHLGARWHAILMSVLYKIIDVLPVKEDTMAGSIIVQEMNSDDNKFEIKVLNNIGNNGYTCYDPQSDTILVLEDDLSQFDKTLVGLTIKVISSKGPDIIINKTQ